MANIRNLGIYGEHITGLSTVHVYAIVCVNLQSDMYQ